MQSDLGHIRDPIPDYVSGPPESWMINDNHPIPRHVQVAVFVRRLIVRSDYAVGTKLPSVPELASQYGVSPDTAIRAMALLKSHGLVESRRGSGHYVLRAPERRLVLLPPGAEVHARMPLATESPEWLSMLMYVVKEPGKTEVVYESAVTDLIVAVA